MWVVKVGGSLAGSAHLRDWLSLLAGEGASRVIIVPGGGRFADSVRQSQAQWSYDDSTAHRMAILAMEQYGIMLTGIEPRLRYAATQGELQRALEEKVTPVWLSWPMVINEPSLPQDWSCTSDSLALWLAIRMNAEALLLLKSAPLPPSRSLPEMSTAGLLDGHFPKLARNYAGRMRWLAAAEYESARVSVQRDELPGDDLVR